MTFLVKGLSFAGLVGAAFVQAGWLGRVWSGVPALAGVERRLVDALVDQIALAELDLGLARGEIDIEEHTAKKKALSA
jgi:hypothetical protein